MNASIRARARSAAASLTVPIVPIVPIVLLALLALVALGRPARPAPSDPSPTVVVDDWEPGAIPIFDLLSLARTRVPAHLAPSFGLQLGYVAGLVELAREDDVHAIDAELVSERVRADEALALGFANRVSAPGAARATAIALGEEIAANGPRAVRAALGILRRATDLPWPPRSRPPRS